MSHITSPTDVYTLDTRIFFKHLSREKPLALIYLLSFFLFLKNHFPVPYFLEGGRGVQYSLRYCEGVQVSGSLCKFPCFENEGGVRCDCEHLLLDRNEWVMCYYRV